MVVLLTKLPPACSRDVRVTSALIVRLLVARIGRHDAHLPRAQPVGGETEVAVIQQHDGHVDRDCVLLSVRSRECQNRGSQLRSSP
jgi:hypothetical protein